MSVKEKESEPVAIITSELGAIEMAPVRPSRLEDLAHQLGTHGGTPRFWAPDTLLPHTEYERGVPPPAGHMWWRCATQMALGKDGCKLAGVPPYQLRRRFKPPGAKAKPRGSGVHIGEVGTPTTGYSY